MLLLRRSPLKSSDKRDLWTIFSILYLDMYDIALYIGYAIFLSPAFIRTTEYYQAGLYFSFILIFGQLAKVIGFFHSNISRNRSHYSQYTNLFIIALCYLAIFVVLYEYLTLGSIFALGVIRVIQGYFFGKEIGFVIDHARNKFLTGHHQHIYYFILLSGELGAFVSILINRTLMSHDYTMVTNLYAWYVQLICAICYLIMLIVIRLIFPVRIVNSYYHAYKFSYMLKNELWTVFLRSLVGLFHVLLIFILIYRFPIFLHIGYHLKNDKINEMLIFITFAIILGVRIVVVINKYVDTVKLMKLLFIFTICWTSIMIVIPYHYLNLYYTMFVVAIVYGAFIRITPTYLYHVKDFHPDFILINRYTSYFVGYQLLAPFMVLALDVMHYYSHTYEDNGLAWTTLAAAIIGFIGLILYNRVIIKRQ